MWKYLWRRRFNWDRLIPVYASGLLVMNIQFLEQMEAKKDWVYVEDVAKGYLGVADKLFSDSDKVSMFYNFAAETTNLLYMRRFLN